ncbi:MAG TPA: hypothetical protein VGF45_24195 [Polyangia bacterium]
MLGPALVSLTLLASPDLGEIRAQRSLGVALAPAMAFHHMSDGFLLPLGFAVDKLLGARWGVSAAVARFPDSEGPITQLSLGGRAYLSSGAVAPYVAADLGLETDPVGYGPSRKSPFLLGGVGVECATRSGLFVALDGALGPHLVDVGGASREWQVLGRTRVLLGLRI